MVAITKLYILAPLIYIKQCSSLIAVFVLYNYIVILFCFVLRPSYNIVYM